MRIRGRGGFNDEEVGGMGGDTKASERLRNLRTLVMSGDLWWEKTDVVVWT